MTTTMPEALLPIYNGISNELMWLNAKWKVFTQLYATNDERLNLLNTTAPSFFRILQKTFVDDFALSISRLTDPPRDRKRENMSLLRLVEALKMTCNQAFSSEIEHAVDEIQELCAPFRVRRNRRLAHLDLPTSFDEPAASLPTTNRQMIEDALAVIGKVLNRISLYYDDAETFYAGIMLHGDGDTLARYLEQGQRAIKQQRNDRTSREK